MTGTTGTATGARGEGRRDAPREPSTIPQWAVDAVVRPVLVRLFRLIWRIRFEGVENIPRPEGGLIIAANHQTYIDPFFVSVPIKRPIRYLAWNKAFDWPLIGRLMELLGAWPLEIEGSDPAAIRRSLQWLREGGAVMIFPEGGRGRPDGSMMSFKAGAVRMALEANVPILPVTIRGGHEVWPRDRRLPRLGQIEIIYHPPRKLSVQPGEDARRCARRETDCLAAFIKSAL